MRTNKARDRDFLRAALRLARRGLGNTAPNPAVGCILVKNDVVVGRGWTQPGGRPHAETQALNQAQSFARGATAYVTLEPCAHHGQTPPCAESLVQAGVARVVIAISDPDPRVAGRGVKILKTAGIEVVEEALHDAAWRANLGFFKRVTLGRPAFTLKLATSHDGRIPGPHATGDDKWITSAAARDRGHLLRAQHDAVLFGMGTVRIDNPIYTCRLKGLEDQSPVRVVLDSGLSIGDDANVLRTLNTAPVWIVTRSGADPDRVRALEARGVTIIEVARSAPSNARGVDLNAVAGALAARGLNRVLIETGPALTSSFVRAGLVDDVYWFRAAQVLGGEGVAPFDDFAREKLALAPQAVLQAGPDRLEIYTVEN